MEKRPDNRGLFFFGLHTYRFMTSVHHVTESGRTTPDIHPTICTHRTHDLYTSHPTICTHCIQRSVHIARTIYTHHTLRSVHIASYGLYTSHPTICTHRILRSVHIARTICTHRTQSCKTQEKHVSHSHHNSLANNRCHHPGIFEKAGIH